MISDRKRRRAVRKIKPGDGHALKPYRWWQLFTRTLFHLETVDDAGRSTSWSVEVKLGGDENGNVIAKLYRSGQHEAASRLPAAFPVPGGTVVVEASGFGLKRCHLVTDDGSTRQLVPDRASAEGRRASLDRNHPTASRALGIGSVAVLVVGLVLGVPQIVEQVTQIPPVAENIGTFTSPFHFAGWFNIALTVGALLASTERALRLRYNAILDAGLFDGFD